MAEPHWDLVIDERRGEYPTAGDGGLRGVALSAATTAGFTIGGWYALSGLDPVSAVASSVAIAIPLTTLLVSLSRRLPGGEWAERAIRRGLRPGWIRWTALYGGALGTGCGLVAVGLLGSSAPKVSRAAWAPWLVPAAAVSGFALFGALRLAFVAGLRRRLRL